MTGGKIRRATVLIVVRHAVTPLNEKGMVQGARSDVALGSTGKKQAEMLAGRLMDFSVDAIYSSDMKRCRQTIAPYLKKTGVHVRYLKELRERDYGIFDGKAEQRYTAWKKKNGVEENFDAAPPKGESFKQDVMNRVGRALKYILKREGGRTVLICGHNSVNKALMLVLFSQDPERHYGDYRFDNAGITVVSISGGKPRIILNSSKAHMR